MFVLMGLLLDRSGVARNLLTSVARLLGPVRGGLAITITVIGILLAATTGIIGASVVLRALLGLPVMMEHSYDRRLAAAEQVEVRQEDPHQQEQQRDPGPATGPLHAHA